MDEITITENGEESKPDQVEMVSVPKAELENWLKMIRDYKHFKSDCEDDIGAVAEQMFKLKTMDIDITRLLRKAMMGNMDLKKELGLDLDALDHIVKKYAPQTAARLAAQIKQ